MQEGYYWAKVNDLKRVVYISHELKKEYRGKTMGELFKRGELRTLESYYDYYAYVTGANVPFELDKIQILSKIEEPNEI